MREGPFGLSWFWHAAVVIIAVGTVVLLVLTIQHQQQLGSQVRAEAARGSATRVTFIGDSYSAGTGASDRSRSFVSLLAKNEGWQALNFARGGTGYSASITDPSLSKRACGLDVCPAYSGMIATIAAAKPSIVVVSGGRNDTHIPVSQESATIRSFYAALRKALPDSQIYATSPIWSTGPPPSSIDDMRVIVASAVSNVGGEFLDIGEPLRQHRDWVARDGVHPNNAGHVAIAAAIQAAL